MLPSENWCPSVLDGALTAEFHSATLLVNRIARADPVRPGDYRTAVSRDRAGSLATMRECQKGDWLQSGTGKIGCVVTCR
jgi:hypothetical protein